MDIKPIKTRDDYETAIATIERLMEKDDSDPAVADALEVLAILVSVWQQEHNPIPSAKPVDALKAAMDDRGLSRKDLARAIGSESKVSEILGGRRGLSSTMIASLHKIFHIPLRSLVDLDAEPKRRGLPAKKKTGRRTRRPAVAFKRGRRSS